MYADLLLGGVAFILSIVGVGMIGRWAHTLGLVDYPNERSSHTRPTPRGGGAAIAVGVLASVAIGAARQTGGSHVVVWTLAAGWVAAIGLIDDLSSLSSRLRLLLQTAAAATVMLYYGHWTTLAVPVAGPVHLGWFGIPITAMWLVSLTNAFNFMDGIDGIAGLQGVVAGLGWTAVGWMFGIPVAQLVGLCVVGASLGFLYHGRPPARVFMGDVGSTFLGFTLASLAVMSAPGRPTVPLMGLLFVWPFVFDSGYTLLKRLARRENVFSAHRSHLYQRLVAVGYRHRAVAAFYTALAALTAGGGLWWGAGGAGGNVALVTALTMSTGLPLVWVRWGEAGRMPRRGQREP